MGAAVGIEQVSLGQNSLEQDNLTLAVANTDVSPWTRSRPSRQSKVNTRPICI